MHLSTFLGVLLVALCSVGVTEAGTYGVDCECLCCVPDPDGPCNPTDIGFIHLNSTVCDKKECVDTCAQIFFTCEDERGTLDAGCTDSPAPPSTVAPSSTSSITSSTTTASTPLTSATNGTSTTPPNTSPLTTSTTTSPGSSTASSTVPPVSTSSTTSSVSTSPSNANTIMSVFPFSQLLIFASVLALLRV